MGKIILPTGGDSRTEVDFLLNIHRIIETDPDAKKWHYYYGLSQYSPV